MKNKTGNILVIAIIIIIIAITAGVLGWLFAKKSQIFEQQGMNQTATKNNENNSATIPSDLNTYTNTKYSFSIKYPKSYIVKEIKDGVITISSPSQKGPFDLNIQVNQDPSLNNLDLDSVIQNKLKNYSIQNPQKITLAGKDAYEGMGTGMVKTYSIIVKNESKLYELSFNTGNKVSFEENKLALDENQKLMLSSFQFTNSQTTDAFTDWDTYSSDNLKISFQYPKDWYVKEEKMMGSGYRIYIKNTEKDVTKETTPEDFQQVIISTWEQEATKQKENRIKNGCCGIKNELGNFVESNGKVKAGSVENDNFTIRTYEFISEGGPIMEAYWEDVSGKIYFASNSSEVGDVNQQKMIENLKKILATIKFLN